MRFEAHGYQRSSIEHVECYERSALFLDMGMGKSVITLTAIESLKYDCFDVRKVLIIAPKLVARSTWDSEMAKWDHTRGLTCSKVLGTEKQRLKALEAGADIYLINRENVCWLVELFGKQWPFDMVVVDELSSFKNPASRRFRSLKKVMPLTKRFIGLTGTPAPNGYMDLWSELYLIDGGERLGKTLTSYRDKYFTPGRRNGHIVYEWLLKEDAEKAIQEKIKDVCMSLTADDWLDVPDMIISNKFVELEANIMGQYKDFAKHMLMETKDAPIVADSAGVLTNKLLQFANGAIYTEDKHIELIHDAKLDALEELIEEANGKPVMVFYAYKHDQQRISKRFNTMAIADLEEEGSIERWNKGQVDMLLVHPASVAYGLNLQDGGNIIIWFGLTWSLEAYQQANARLHRQGQRQKVLLHHIVSKGTVDEDVLRSLDNKNMNQRELIEAVKARINSY